MSKEMKWGSRFFTGFSSLFSAKLQTFCADFLSLSNNFLLSFSDRMLLLLIFHCHSVGWRQSTDKIATILMMVEAFSFWSNLLHDDDLGRLLRFFNHLTAVERKALFTSRSTSHWTKTIIRQWRKTESSRNRFSTFCCAIWYDAWCYSTHCDEVRLGFLLKRKFNWMQLKTTLNWTFFCFAEIIICYCHTTHAICGTFVWPFWFHFNLFLTHILY